MTLAIFFLAAFLGAIGGALIKYSLYEFPPLVLVFLRAFLATLFLYPITLVMKRKLVVKKEIRLLILTNIFFALNWILYAYGIEKTSLIMGQIIYLPTAIIVAILSYFFLNEKLSKMQLIGLTLTVSGLSILIYNSVLTGNVLSFGEPIGNFIIVIGLFAWSLFTIISRKISKHYSTLTLTFTNLFTTTLLSLVLVVITGSFKNLEISQVSFKHILALIVLAITNSIFFFGLYQWLIKNTSAFSASLVLYPATILSGVLGILFFDEQLTLNLVLGGMLVVAGVFLANSLTHIQKYARRKN